MNDWNSRKNRNFIYDYKPGTQTRRLAKELGLGKSTNNQSTDTKNRKMIMDEIEFRVKKGENIDKITTDIAERDEVKEQFSYLLKHGITDLAKVFKGWYEAKERNRLILDNLREGEL